MCAENLVTVVVGRFDEIPARGLAGLLREDPRICLLGTDLDVDALEVTLKQDYPRVLIVDETVGCVVRARMRVCRARPEIVVLAYKPTLVYGMLLLAAGASCVPWSAPDLGSLVIRVARGKRILVSPSGGVVAYRSAGEPPLLSAREVEVLRYLSSDLQYAQIADRLGIASETVRRHTTSICRKLGALGRRELVGIPVPCLFPC